MSSRSILLLATALFLIPAAGFAEPEMKEGKWEMTMKMDMPGLPFQLPPMKVSTCISKENPVPQPEQKGQECTIKDTQTKGNTVSWVVDCKDKKSTTHQEGQLTYHGDTFEGSSKTTTKDKNGESEVIQKMSGRYLGPCQ